MKDFPHITHHAIDRARDRYNLVLGPQDAQAIYQMCVDGKATLLRTDRAAKVFLLRFGDVLVVPVLAVNEGQMKLVTFEPLDSFHAGNGRRRAQAKGCLKQRTGVKSKGALKFGPRRVRDRLRREMMAPED